MIDLTPPNAAPAPLQAGRDVASVTVWTEYRMGDAPFHNRERMALPVHRAVHIGADAASGDFVPGGIKALTGREEERAIPRDLLDVLFRPTTVAVRFTSPSSPRLRLRVNDEVLVNAHDQPIASTSMAWSSRGRIVLELSNTESLRTMLITADITSHVDGSRTLHQLGPDEELFRHEFVEPMFAKGTKTSVLFANALEWCDTLDTGSRVQVDRMRRLTAYLIGLPGRQFADQRKRGGYIRELSEKLFKLILSDGSGVARTNLDSATWKRYDRVLRTSGLAAIGSDAGEEFDASTDGTRVYRARNDVISLLRIVERLLASKLVARDDWSALLPPGQTR